MTVKQGSLAPLDWQDTVQGLDASALLRETFRQFDDVALACSLQAEDVILLDLISHIDASVEVFILDTGRLHPTSYQYAERLQVRYGRPIRFVNPNSRSVEGFTFQYGINGFYNGVEARQACCGVRKVEPLQRVLSGKSAWVTGLRRVQALSRSQMPRTEWDQTNGGLMKVNPLLYWSDTDVKDYVRIHEIPLHPLYAEGFASIGCAPCTRAVEAHEDPRAGRWWWESSLGKECGLHVRRVES